MRHDVTFSAGVTVVMPGPAHAVALLEDDEIFVACLGGGESLRRFHPVRRR